MKRVKKVVAYITSGPRLLILEHRDIPEIGMQVPAGTVDPGEDLAEAAIREAQEETGLQNLRVVSYLGTCDEDISYLRPEVHERHFFHLEALPPFEEKWQHAETKPSGGDQKEIWYNFYWVEKGRIGRDLDQLFFGFGAMLDRLP
jgi:8-oxo-dGTP pyrophosphatase MutT (NUDIX family)